MSDPVRPWGELLSITIEKFSTAVEDMHHAIARPWFRLTGPLAPELRGAYAGATSAVYRSVRMVASAAGNVVDGIRVAPRAEPTGRSDAVQAFTNAVWGDELARRGSAMAIDMRVRDRFGRVVETEAGALAQSFPDASGRIAVLIHGLGQTEKCFARGGSGGGLAAEIAASSFTPVSVRYNTGRTVAESGGDLSALLADLVAQWPVPVTDVALVGYSMGGLVGRAALDAGRANAERWREVVRHVVTVATPHAGSPIERSAVAVSQALMVAPQSKPLARFLDGRSAGIRDLRSGAGLAPVPDGVQHHRIAAVITADASHPLGALVGDLVVRPDSATSQASSLAGERVVIGGRRHFDILDDESIAHHILEWIESN